MNIILHLWITIEKNIMILNKTLRNLSIATIACFIGTTGIVNANEMDSNNTIVFTGYDDREDADFAYVGVTHYLNNDMHSDGFVIRALASDSDYEYKTISGKTDADANSAEVMLGYQKVMESFVARGFIGVDYEDHDLSPDNRFDDNRGDTTGVKAQVELETLFSSANYGSLLTSYSTANDRYFARLRAGHDFSGFVVGPEAIFLGDQEYNEQRIGAFLMVKKAIPVVLTVSAGYADPDTDRGDSSGYFSLEVSKGF